MQKELKEKEDDARNLRSEVNRLTLINDEFQEKNAYYQKKCRDRTLEQEKTVKAVETVNTQRLNDIEKMLTNIQGDIVNRKQSEVVQEYQRPVKDTAKDEAIEALENELENDRRDFKKLANLLKKLIVGLRRSGLNNANTVEFFKLGEVNFGSKEDVRKNLLKIVAAFYFTAKSRKALASSLDRWKSLAIKTPKRTVKSRKTASRKPKQEPVIESRRPKKVQLEDISESDLNDLKELLKGQIMNEIEFERANKDKGREEFRGNASEIYYRILEGLTRYFFSIFNVVVDEAKQKHEYLLCEL
eukprot:TRINITY_DN11365_c0_g1_i1.p1 TRINITY_DN11365_c0_g1~~TRINITY_DN11365_c0_g1_i1.p1  ORF type:complete len:301 (+),score=84.45 TRINITY_DN11365_c0_g1_i1:692-1594(+)